MGSRLKRKGPKKEGAFEYRKPTGQYRALQRGKGPFEHRNTTTGNRTNDLHASVFYFTFKGKLFVKCLPFQGLASLEKVNNIFYLFHQFIKNPKISEFRAKIKGKLLKTSSIKQKISPAAR